MNGNTAQHDQFPLTANNLRHNHAYRTALALNNMATTLMRQGYYGTALTTISDSLNMMQVAFGHPASEHSASTQESHRTNTIGNNNNSEAQAPHERILRAASKRFFRTIQRSYDHRQNVSSGPSTTDQKDLFSTAAASLVSTYFLDEHASLPTARVHYPIEDENVADLRSAIQYHHCAAGRRGCCLNSIDIFPKRISGFSSLEESNQLVVTKNLGIVLYNHGLAAVLTSLRQRNLASQQDETIQERSLKSFHLAKSTFVSILERARVLSKNNKDSMQLDDDQHQGVGFYDDPSTLLLTALSLDAMCLILRSKPEMTCQLAEVQQAAACLCSSVAEIESWMGGLGAAQ